MGDAAGRERQRGGVPGRVPGLAGDPATPLTVTPSRRVEALQQIVAQYYVGRSEAAVDAALAQAERAAAQHSENPTYADLPLALRGYLDQRRAERTAIETGETPQAVVATQPDQQQVVDAAPAPAEDPNTTLDGIPAPAMGNEDEARAGGSALDELTPADQVRARRLVADHAGRYGVRLGRDAAVRYVVEGHFETGLRGAYASRVLREVAEELIPAGTVVKPRDDRAQASVRRRNIERSVEPHLYRLNREAWTPATVRPLLEALTDSEQVDPDAEIVLPTDTAVTVETLRQQMQAWLDDHAPAEQDTTPTETPDSRGISTSNPDDSPGIMDADTLDSPGTSPTDDPIRSVDQPALDEPSQATQQPPITTDEDAATPVSELASTPEFEQSPLQGDDLDVADLDAAAADDSPGITSAGAPASDAEPEQGDQATAVDPRPDSAPDVDSEAATPDEDIALGLPADPEISASSPRAATPQEDATPAETPESTAAAIGEEAPEPRRWQATIDLRNQQSADEDPASGTGPTGDAEAVQPVESSEAAAPSKQVDSQGRHRGRRPAETINTTQTATAA